MAWLSRTPENPEAKTKTALIHPSERLAISENSRTSTIPANCTCQATHSVAEVSNLQLSELELKNPRFFLDDSRVATVQLGGIILPVNFTEEFF